MDLSLKYEILLEQSDYEGVPSLVSGSTSDVLNINGCGSFWFWIVLFKALGYPFPKLNCKSPFYLLWCSSVA